MRCVEVARELSAPTGKLAPDILAGHLASCPECAAWAGRVERLDRLWKATRPVVPAASWDAVWARVSRPAEAPPIVRPSPARWGVRRVLIGVAIAQAAVVLIAALILLGDHQPKPDIGDEHPAPIPTPIHGFEANPGEILTLHIEGNHQVSVDRRPQEGVSETDTVAWVHDLYNGIEVIASVSP